MGLRSRFGLLAATLIVLNVAGLLWIRHERLGRGRPALRVLSVLPTQDVDSADRFSLLFDEPLAGRDAIGGSAAEPLFVIHPQPHGHWTWSQPDRLDFVLDEPLPPGRVFTVKPALNLETRTGRVLIGPREYRFQTRPLRLDSCELHTADREEASIELIFNQPVAPADLLRNLLVTDAATSRPMRTTCLTSKPNATLIVRCDRPAKNQLLVQIKPQLTGHGGELGLEEAVRRSIDLPETFSLLRAEAVNPDLEPDWLVHLQFSADLDPKRSVPPVEVSPPVENMNVRLSWGQLVLQGPFQSGRKYTLTVGADAMSDKGERLGTRQSVILEVPDRDPALRFPLSRGTLMPGGQMRVDLKAVNVAGLKLTAHRVHANNLIAHVRGDRPLDTSRELWRKDIPLSLARNAISTLSLDLRELLGGGGSSVAGIYVIKAEAADRSWTDDDAIVTVSDLVITAKRERKGCLAWVTSLRSGQAVGEVQVAALTRNNQVLAAAVTDESGLAHLDIPEQHPDGSLYILTAQLGDDLNYLLPDRQAWVIDQVDQSGKRYPDTYDIMLYTERGIYRPGDVVHLTGLIRDATGAVPPVFPLAITTRRPDGRKVDERVVTPKPDTEGFFHADFAAPEAGQLGRYEFAVSLPGDKKTLGGTSALIEEYVPVRMEVSAEPVKPLYTGDSTPALQVRARYLFDQPGAQLPVKVTATYKRVSYQSKRFPEHVFTDPREGEEVEAPAVEATLDAGGAATVEVPLDEDADDACWQAKVSATVSEPGGRSVSAHARIDLDTAGRHVGLRAPRDKLLAVGEPIRVAWVQLTADDEPAEPVGLSWSLHRVEYDTTLEMVDGRYVWKSEERLTQVSQGRIAAPDTAEGGLEVTCGSAGLYRLKVSDVDGLASTQIDLRAISDIDREQTLALDAPERLRIVLDQDRYLPGSSARVLVESPFAGTLLLTLETDRVLLQRVARMEANTIHLDMTIPGDLRGGAFLAANVVRAVDPARDKWLPARAAGLARVVVDHRAKVLPVTIEAPTRAEPAERIRVTVRAAATEDGEGRACVHLWAVDEGILKTIAFKTPDPVRHFLAPHESAIVSADGYGWLLPDYQRPASMVRIGGDEADSLAARRSLVPAQKRDAAVLWRTVMPLGADGTATAPVSLPDATGELRFMAVVAGRDCYGSAQRAVTVTAPLLIEASWPRFAAPGDRFDVPVKIFNAGATPLDVTLSPVHLEGPLEVQLPAEPTLRVDPGKPATIWLAARATGMGLATVHLQARAVEQGDPLIATARADLPIRPGTALAREARLLRSPASRPIEVAVPGAFIPGTVRATVSVGAQPTVEMQPALAQLIDYPYGCAEQITSRLLGLLYAPELLAADSSQGPEIGARIDAGIVRLWSMQTVSGGLGYWPGDSYADVWVSAYGASFLLRARQAGYRVDRQLTEPLVDYLAGEVQKVDERVDPNIRAMLCGVLAGFGRPAAGWMDRLAERTDELDIAGRADLASAFLSVGKRDRALAILQDDTIQHRIATTTGGRLTSQVHQDARLLHVLLDLDPNHPWIDPLVQRLDKARAAGGWAGTLENASALSALSRYQRRSRPAADFTGSIRCGDEQAATFTSREVGSARIRRVNGPIVIESAGSGDLCVSVLFEGLLRQDQSREYDHQLRARRRWLDRTGTPLDPAALKVGDLVRVEIELAAPSLGEDEQIDNVAIVDALPGGLEIENPRLLTSVDAPSLASEAVPDRVEFRDDRVLLFTSVGREPRIFRYSLRAITAGSFVAPPLEASSMYNPQFASLQAGGRAEISK